VLGHLAFWPAFSHLKPVDQLQDAFNDAGGISQQGVGGVIN
jgi:hypothetical protein